MSSSIHILASADGAEKLIGAVIFILIWIVSAAAQWVKKQKEQQSDQQRRAQLRNNMRITPSSLPPAPPRPFPPARHMPAARPAPPGRFAAPPPRAMPSARAKSPLISATRPAPPTVPPAVPAPQPMTISVGPSAAHLKRPAPAAASAASIAHWLAPGTLRQQFILTEVLQPPLALRPERW
jgi:hypothetical protein